MAIGMETATQERTFMDGCGLVLELATKLEGTMDEFISGGERPSTSTENKPHPVFPPLKECLNRLERTVVLLETASKHFQVITSKIA